MTTTRKAERAAEPHLFAAIELPPAYKLAGVAPLCVTCEDIEDVAVHVKPLAANVEGLLHAGVLVLANMHTGGNWDAQDMRSVALKVAAVNRVTLDALKGELDRLRLVNAAGYGDHEEDSRFSAYDEVEEVLDTILAILMTPGAGYR